MRINRLPGYHLHLLANLQGENMKKTRLTSLIFAAAAVAASASASAQAGDVYLGLGFPFYTVGYAYTLNDAVGLRGEYSGLGTVKRDRTEDGITYRGRFKHQMIGAYGDWHPMAGGFRVVGGITLNDTKVNLVATGATATANINGKRVSLAGETYNVDLIYPKVTPYVGVGYGFSPRSAPGFGFYVDAGVTIGKFKTEATTSLVGRQGITQADVDAETAQLRESTAKLSVLPKFSVGVNYRF